VGEQVIGILFHCHECRKGFKWELSLTHAHWSDAMLVGNGPTYCPCCGAYACLYRYPAPERVFTCDLQSD